jgi:poly(3-hydroxybutyrate) depolymerase
LGAGGSVGTGGLTASGGKIGTGGAVGTGGSGDGGTKSAGGSSTPASGTGGSGAGGSTGSGIDGGTATTGRSAGCGKPPTAITSSQYNNGTTIPITAASLQRRYILNVPTNYDNSKPYTLVVTIHARDGNDVMMYNWQYYGLLPESKDTAIFAAPNGQKNGAPCSGTAVGDSNCGWPNTNGQDMALMDAVVKQVEDNFCVDTNHIYATGWSYGASMSYEVGCERPLGGTGTATWGVRAIAIYSGAQMSGSCKPTTPVGFYASHGTHDSVLNYNGGVSLAQNFATANGCTWATPTSVTSGAHVCTNEAGCKAGYPLEFCSFNGDHTPFPDTGQSAGSWGPAEVWKFFSQF